MCTKVYIIYNLPLSCFGTINKRKLTSINKGTINKDTINNGNEVFHLSAPKSLANSNHYSNEHHDSAKIANYSMYFSMYLSVYKACICL